MLKIWILDYGATNHIASTLDLFAYVKPLTSTSVKLPNSTSAQVKHSGNVIISPNFTFEYVLHVLNFNFNMKSIGQLAKHLNRYFFFLTNYCYIQLELLKRFMDYTTWRRISLDLSLLLLLP